MTGRTLLAKSWPWAAASLSGLLLALCYPGFDLGGLCWVALTPLVTALMFATDNGKRRWLKKSGLAFCAGTVFFCINFAWLTTVTSLMKPSILGLLGLFLLDCYLALYWGLWGCFFGSVLYRQERDSTRLLSSRFNLWLGLSSGLAWAAQEWLRGVVFSGFGWNNVGVALHDVIAMIQVADITGVGGLSALVVMVNVIIVVTVRRFIMEVQNRKLRPHFDFTITLTLIGVVFGYGVHRLQSKPETIPLIVASVQANIPQNEKWDSKFEDQIFETYKKWTTFAIAMRPQLILWPEAATPRGIFADQISHDFVMDLVTKTDANFLMGTIDSDDQYDYNIAALFTNRGVDEMQSYRKMHLVPFGEYIPFRESFPLFSKLVGELVRGDFRPGVDYNVLQMRNPDIKVGSLICFEDTIGDLARHFPLNGAQLLVNITNDGWFLKSVESRQHVANAIFRSVENHRPMVRCTNTGMTCYIDSVGRITQTLLSKKGEVFTEGILKGKVDVPVNGEVTFYTRHGEWLPVGSLFLALATTAAHFFNRRRRKSAA